MGNQCGAVLLVMLIILIMGAAAMLINSLNSASPRSIREKIAVDMLVRENENLIQAKEALIAYAINSENTGGATARPGNFPCPDTDAPGTAGYGVEQPSCSSGGVTPTIGRLPWKTLGIPELLDADGEPLWYAVSDNFRKIQTIINSDTTGTLNVYNFDGSTSLTPLNSEAVAIVFAPGKIIGTQQRVTALDKTTASNYLESAYGYNNATAANPSISSFIAANKSDSFNDRLMIIRTRDFIPIIENKIALLLKSILENYRTANSVYPYPAPFSSCKSTSTCDSNSSICRGSFPYNANTMMPSLPNWGMSLSTSLPKAGTSSWFVDNFWYRVIYYSANCTPTINVSGNYPTGLFFMPGTPLGSTVRSYTPSKTLSWYLEDSSNYDNSDNNYVNPTSISNDQLYTLP
jgi:hypothetical protein